MTWRLDPRCEFGILAASPHAGEEHEDVGDGLQGPESRQIRRALDPLRKRLAKLGEAKALQQSESLIRAFEATAGWDALCTKKSARGRRILRENVLFPKHTAVPSHLQIRWASDGGTYRGVTLPVKTKDWAAIHDFLALVGAGTTIETLHREAGGAHRDILSALLDAQWLRDDPEESIARDVSGFPIWFVGHNTAVVSSKKARVAIDPWIRPRRDADPADYKPIRACDLGRLDAVLITHTHGDHFHLGTLLQLPRTTRIILPKITRASILSPELEPLLRSVGFTNVTSLDWWETTKVGDIFVGAMPFYGEQPSAIDVIDPLLRNVGNTWFLRTPTLSAAFLADTGADALGSMSNVASQARAAWGPADLVFSGMRGFELPPLFLPFTSLDAMFANVPLDLLPVRQRLMHDANDLLTVAQIFGAKYAVPYADGGAPWYWREQMGPAYAWFPTYPDERVSPGQDMDEPGSAPFPERLQEASLARFGDAGPVEPLVLRPGDLVDWKQGRARVGSVEGYGWPA